MTPILSIKEHIQNTIAMIESLEAPSDFTLRKKLARMVGDQYEALIEISASELRSLEQVDRESTSFNN